MNIRPASPDPIGFIVRSKAGEGRLRYVNELPWSGISYTSATCYGSLEDANRICRCCFPREDTRARYEVVPVFAKIGESDE